MIFINPISKLTAFLDSFKPPLKAYSRTITFIDASDQPVNFSSVSACIDLGDCILISLKDPEVKNGKILLEYSCRYEHELILDCYRDRKENERFSSLSKTRGVFSERILFDQDQVTIKVPSEVNL